MRVLGGVRSLRGRGQLATRPACPVTPVCGNGGSDVQGARSSMRQVRESDPAPGTRVRTPIHVWGLVGAWIQVRIPRPSVRTGTRRRISLSPGPGVLSYRTDPCRRKAAGTPRPRPPGNLPDQELDLGARADAVESRQLLGAREYLGRTESRTRATRQAESQGCASLPLVSGDQVSRPTEVHRTRSLRTAPGHLPHGTHCPGRDAGGRLAYPPGMSRREASQRRERGNGTAARPPLDA